MTTLNPADLAQLDQATAQCLDKADALAALYDHLDPAEATMHLCGELAAYVVSTGELGSILGAMAALVVDRRRKKINARTTVRMGVRVTKDGPKIRETKPAKGMAGKLIDKALKSQGR